MALQWYSGMHGASNVASWNMNRADPVYRHLPGNYHVNMGFGLTAEDMRAGWDTSILGATVDDFGNLVKLRGQRHELFFS